jgi:hypothetical protein
VDTAVLLEALDDALDRDSGAGHMPTHGIAGAEHVPVSQIKRGHVVVHLGRVHRAADALEGRAHLLGDLVDAMRENLESNWIDARHNGI